MKTEKIDFDERFAINCAMSYLAEIGKKNKMTESQFLKFANSKEGLEIAVSHAREAMKYLNDNNFTFNV